MKCSLALFCAAAVWSVAAQTPELGVCAHLTWDEFAELDRACDMCAAAGFKWVRCDFEWSAMQKRRGDGFAFAHFDAVVEAAEKRGLTILPILLGPPAWAHPVVDHLDEWSNYVHVVVAHYGDRLPAVEIWNEENLEHFWPNVNAADYVRLLKTAATAVRAANPKIRVVLGGLSGVPHDYIRDLYVAGGREYFDVMNVHPYSWPVPPEGDKASGRTGLKADLLGLRKLMAENGDADKPVWITEHGWPTHWAKLPEALSLVAGLKLANPGRAVWRVAYACLAEPTEADRRLAAELADILPKGSSVEACSPRRLNGALPKGAFDAVVYPFGESFPVETADAVVGFVSRGGTLVDFGGLPMFYPKGEGERMRQRLRIGISASWTDAALPESLMAQPTAEAKAVGLVGDPRGFRVHRFFTAQCLREGDRMIPMLVGKDKAGRPTVGACVYKFGSDMKGAVVVSCRGNMIRAVSEQEQSDYLKRAIGIAADCGVAKYFIYEFRSPERSPFCSEDNFGIVHADFSPKPAYRMLTAATRADPHAAYVDSAFSVETRGRKAAELRQRLADVQVDAMAADQRTDRVLASCDTDDFVRIRVAKRREIRKNLRTFVETQLAHGDASGLGFAERGIADLRKALEIQDEEIRYLKDRPDLSRAEILNLADFGAVGDGKTDDAKAFQRAFAAIRAKHGAPTVLRLPAGTFFFNSMHDANGSGPTAEEPWRTTNGESAQLLAAGLANCRIVGAGSDKTFLSFGVFDGKMVDVFDCRNVSLEGVDIAMRDVPFAEGIVKSFDTATGDCVLKVKPGSWPLDDWRWNASKDDWRRCGSLVHVFTNGARVGHARAFPWSRRAQNLGDGRWKLFFDLAKFEPHYRRFAENVRPGMTMAVAARNNYAHGIDIMFSSGVTFEDVVLHNSRSAGFCSAHSRLISMRNCHLRPKAGWSLSSDADGCYTDLGTFLLDCSFKAMGDDGLNLRTYAQVIERVLPPNAVVTRNQDGGTSQPGDIAAISDKATGRYLCNLRFAQPDSVVSNNCRTSLFAETVATNLVGKFLYAHGRYGFGSVVSGCTFSDGWLAGNVIQVPNALIENTTFDNINEGVRVGALCDYREGPPPYNVMVRNCRFSHLDAGFVSYVRVLNPNGGMGESEASVVRGLDVRGNAFEHIRWEAIQPRSCADCSFAGNSFRDVLKPMKGAAFANLPDEIDRADRKADDQVAAIKTSEALAAWQKAKRTAWLDGLGGLPERTPLDAQEGPVIACDGFTLRNVLFESQPGVYVVGHLALPMSSNFRPPYPAVLMPLGHSDNGILNPVYAVHLAMMARAGFAAFAWDPVSQGERRQFPAKYDGRWGNCSSEHTALGARGWLVGWNFARFLVWDGMRALDYLTTRPDVDATRIGVCGTSGGGTQSAYLQALDPRITVAFPNCFISSIRKVFLERGCHDAEQFFWNQLNVGLNHAAMLAMGLGRVSLATGSRWQDYFPQKGAEETFAVYSNLWARLGAAGRSEIGLWHFHCDGPHGLSLPTRRAQTDWMAHCLRGGPGPKPLADYWALSKGDHAGANDPCTGAPLPFPTNAVFFTATHNVRDLPGFRSIAVLIADRARELAKTRAGRDEKDRKDGKDISARYREIVRRRANVRPLSQLLSLQSCNSATLQPFTPTFDWWYQKGAYGFRRENEAAMLATLGRSVVGRNAERIILDAVRTLRPQALRATGWDCIAAAHAYAAEPQLFSGIEFTNPPPSWTELATDPAPGRESFAIAVWGALEEYDWTDLVEKRSASACK